MHKPSTKVQLNKQDQALPGLGPHTSTDKPSKTSLGHWAQVVLQLSFKDGHSNSKVMLSNQSSNHLKSPKISPSLPKSNLSFTWSKELKGYPALRRIAPAICAASDFNNQLISFQTSFIQIKGLISKISRWKKLSFDKYELGDRRSSTAASARYILFHCVMLINLQITIPILKPYDSLFNWPTNPRGILFWKPKNQQCHSHVARSLRLCHSGTAGGSKRAKTHQMF